MPALLLGGRELKARMDATKECFIPAGQRWADDTVRRAKANLTHVKTGTLRQSIHVRKVTKTRATVATRFTGRFIEGDTKAHTVAARRQKAISFSIGGRKFARKSAKRGARRGTPFLAPAGQAALDASPVREELVNAWNRAA